MSNENKTPNAADRLRDEARDANDSANDERPKEIGGRPGPDPTRYGDWEKNGRCIDF